MGLHDRRIVPLAILSAIAVLLYAFSDNFSNPSSPSNSLAKSGSHEKTSRESNASNRDSSTDAIPSIIHFVVGASNDESPVELNFLAFIAIYSAGFYMPNAQVWLHTNASTKMIDQALALDGIPPPRSSASDGNKSGAEIVKAEYNQYWTQAVVKGVKNLKIKQTPRQHYATDTGIPIRKWANWADFVRADVLYEHGGTFLDLDAIMIRDLTPLLNTGFRNILARDFETQCGTVMAVPKSNLMRAYRKFMHIVFSPDSYSFHAVALLHILRETFARVPNELLMVSDRAFYPITWNNHFEGLPGSKELFSIKSDNQLPLGPLGVIKDFDYEAWEQTFAPPDHRHYQPEGTFGLDFSETYIVHAYHSQFTDSIASNPAKLKNGLTLPLVLEGTSHFSRAVMRSVLHAKERGIISV